MADLNIGVAFGAGVLSFISPCVFPLYPSYISYITGMTVSQLQDRQQSAQVRRGTMLHTVFFIVGFSLVFFALGYGASWMGQLFSQYKDLIRMLSGVLLVLMGLFLMGLFRPQFLMKEKRVQVGKKRWGYLGSTVIGVGFAAGWTPCLGPILVGVFALTASNPGVGAGYLIAYTVGFAVPFFIMAFFIGRARWIMRYSEGLMKIGGGLMVLFGILLYFDQMEAITIWMIQLFGGFVGV